MPLVKDSRRSVGNYTPSGRQRRNGSGLGRQSYKPPKVPGIGRSRIKELEERYATGGYDRFCWNCKIVCEKLVHISEGRSLEERSAWICEPCRARVGENRKCKSVKDCCDPAKAEPCQFCHELTDPCRFVIMWKKGELYKSCSVCPSVREGVKEWVCRPDYLLDHSLARCCDCKIIDLSSPRYFSRGRCCKIEQ